MNVLIVTDFEGVCGIAYREKPRTEVRDERTLALKGRNAVEAFARRCGVDYMP